MRCSGTNYTRICRQRETCELYKAFLNTHPGAPVSVESMPVSADQGCYMYRPIEVKTVQEMCVERLLS